jgi:hypothetical protein
MENDVIKNKKTVSDRRKAMRERLWPEVNDQQLWLRKQRTGFTTIPRTMPLIGQMLDQLSGKGFPLLSTYLALWCWVFDEAMVEIRNPREMAYESGFSGPRAETTWRSRMKRLEELGFIQTKPGLAGEYQYVLLLNPLQRIKELYEGKPSDALYSALLGRAAQVGADDLDV